MKLSWEPITITKELILQKVPEEQIMEHYLGVHIQKGLFKSPLRRDNRPTCGFFRNSRGRLMMKDFSGAFCGDCFAVVQEKFQCSYYMALQIIANDFGIIHRPDIAVNKPKIEYSGTVLEERKSAKIQIQTRDFTQKELNWWLRYGINKSTLTKFRVYPVDKVWLNDNLFYQNLDGKFVFGYYGGLKNGLEQWRIYWPGNTKYRFISNWTSNQIQGAHLLSKDGGDFIVITKSLKDCAALYEFGIPAIAPCSENLFVTESQYNRLKEKFKRIYLLYDADIPGIKAAKRIKRDYPDVKVLLLPWGTAKDFSDYRKAFGYKKTLELVQQAKEYYGET